jgi:hypothetical protein
MLDTLSRLALEDTETPAEFTPEWHQQQERLERAWLDAHARAQQLVTAA